MANNTLLASDDFSSGSLSPAKWTAIPTQSQSQVTGSPFVAEAPAVGTPGRQYYSGVSWPNDQISEITVTNLVAGSTVEGWVRVQAGAYSGYVFSINSGTLTLYKCVAGVFTSLTSIGTISVAAGDVWAIQVAGSVITVNLNNKPSLRAIDTTFASGFPGFSQSAATSVANSKIASWRGYSTVQQDGIWTKQGTLAGLAPIAGDGSVGIANASMLFEGNAQLLSGTVYKMWFSDGGAANTYYAESSDGLNWTRRGSAVLAGSGYPFIIKNGVTYHLYTQATPGTGNIAHNTSSDGITWSLQSSNVFGLGTAGQWDDTRLYYFQPVAIIAGTWYALYCAAHSAVTLQLSLGLATSPDGATWTRYVSNPVLQGANSGSVVNGGAIAHVGGMYYMWFYGCQPGMSSVVPSLDPGEGVRYQTTDFINWTNPVHSIHRTQMYEGVNFQTGQTYPNGIFTVGGQTYLYIQSTPSDNSPTIGYQLALAIASAPISSIVGTNEDGMPQIASDVFTSGIGDLSANWATPAGLTKLQIIAGNLAEATAISTYCGMRYTGTSFTDSQYSEISLQVLGTNQTILPAVRMQANGDCYTVQCAGATGSGNANFVVYKRIGGVLTQIGGFHPQVTPQVGDKFRLSVVNVNGIPTLTFYQNQFVVVQMEDWSAAIPSGGNPGFLIFTTTLVQAQVSGWTGGNANVIPTYAGANGLVHLGNVPTLTFNGSVQVGNFPVNQ